jgi:LCP family protein required for cell wall assembly
MQRSGAASLEALRKRADEQERIAAGVPGAAPPAPGEIRPPAAPPAAPRKRRPPWRRVLLWALIAVAGWIGLSIVLFLFSAQFLQDRVDAETRAELSSGGTPVTKPSTVLILGSDVRPKGSREPGAQTSGRGRADSIQLMRVGGGHSAKLSIPRDMVVDVPGYGPNKINAAYALGGSALAVKTVKQFLGIDVDHVIVVNFDEFPDLVDAMGGIDYSGGCVVSRINGGFRNGGYTLRLRAGTTHIDGKQALALSRTRKNECNRREDELTRQRRQQKVVAAMKKRALSPAGFVRWPWVAWRGPQTITSDMGALGLSGLIATIATSGDAPTRILRPDGVTTLPDGGAGLTVSDASKARQTARFLAR